jgi:dolichol kinase
MNNMQTADSGVFEDSQALFSMARALHGFVYKIQKPRLHDKTWIESISCYCSDLYERAAAARASLAGRQKALAEAVDDIMETLKKISDELSGSSNVRKLKELRLKLSRLYEKVLIQIRELGLDSPLSTPRLPHLKPINYYRNIFHVGIGLVCVLLYELVLTWGMAMTLLGITLAVFIGLEVSRRFSERFNDFLVDSIFGIIVRPHERYRVNASTYYLAALTLMTAVTPKTALCMGLLVLAFGDPVASLAGRRWGRKKLWQEKSVAGTLAFFVAALVICLVYLGFAEPEMALLKMALAAVIVSAAGAATELFSQRINDNFTIPVVAAGVASFWF